MARYLVVDDIEQNLYMLRVLLEGYGNEVTTAENGALALEAARSEPPDIIVTDILMPVMDGFALCREWKQDDDLKHIPFVFYTATYTDPKDEEFALSLGAERFLIKPMDPEKLITALQEVRKGGATGQLEALYEPEEEQTFIREYNEALVRKLEKKLEDLDRTRLSLEQEIVERKKAEDELRQHRDQLEEIVEERTGELKASEERMRSTLASLDDLVFVLSPEGVFLDFYQPVSVSSLYVPPEQFMGQSYRELLPPEVADQMAKALDKITHGQEVQQFDYSLQVDGEGRWYNAKISMYRDVAKNMTGVVVVARDITDRKHMEDQLAKANKELRMLSTLKDEFVSNVSHELRTPIASLKLRRYLLEMDPEQVEKHLSVMQREIDRLECIIEDLLQLSRFDQQQSDLVKCPVDINLMVEQFISDRTMLAQEQNLTFAVVSGEKIPVVQADEGLFIQVLSIIVTNAINYSPDGGTITVTIKEKTVDNQQWAGFSVADMGPGITADDQHRLYERFFRGQAGLESKKLGTGLGLAIAKEIVDRHQGRIEVETAGATGAGALFTVWLPVE